MPLHKIKDFDPNYRDHFNGDDIKELDFYVRNERVGSVDDVLVDDEGRFRYLIINTGAWIFGKKVMLPIGRASIDYNARRVQAEGLTREQVDRLPEYDESMLRSYDYDYEEQVRGVYRPAGMGAAPLDATGTMSAGTAMDAPIPVDADVMATSSRPAYTRDNYRYENDPDLYAMNDRDHQSLRLYEERLIANKTRQKTGEVTVGKHVETETARVSVPIEKERVVIERTTPVDAGTAVAAGSANFQEGEVARIEVYEETPDIRKEAFVREEVQVKKVVDRDTVNAEEQIRREELDVDTQGRPVIDNPADRV